MISDRPTLLPSNFQSSNDISLLSMIDLIADTLGIHIQPQHQNEFKRSILTRIRALGLGSLDDYYQHLIAQQQSLSSGAEWQKLIPLLTVNESYFFRDQGQFWLLKNTILPELIERKRQLSLTSSANSQKPALRLWSAGCSTGEEAYSLAMLLKELIPDYQSWDILILGTDINQLALEVAQQGIYHEWSFRTTAPEIKNRYFRSHPKGWEIDSSIREMVTFQPRNLVGDSYPDYLSKIHDLDLILCRNVFIYFDFNAIALVLQKFYRALAPGGFLLTGHAELHGQKTEPFQVKSFPQSVVYQRNSPHPPTPSPKIGEGEPDQSPSPALGEGFRVRATNMGHVEALPPFSNSKRSGARTSCSPRPSLEEDLWVKENIQQTLFNKARRSLTKKAYTEAIQTAKQLVSLAPKHFQAYCLIAEAYANLGQYSHATQACQQAIQINPLAIAPYYVLAQIAEEQGDINGAKLFLKRIIYLTPTAVTAYLELGSIYEQERNVKQAEKTWLSLLEILQSLPQESAIDANNQQPIAELKSQILEHLRI